VTVNDLLKTLLNVVDGDPLLLDAPIVMQTDAASIMDWQELLTLRDRKEPVVITTGRGARRVERVLELVGCELVHQ
jgi:hypothetical protein